MIRPSNFRVGLQHITDHPPTPCGNHSPHSHSHAMTKVLLGFRAAGAGHVYVPTKANTIHFQGSSAVKYNTLHYAVSSSIYDVLLPHY